MSLDLYAAFTQEPQKKSSTTAKKPVPVVTKIDNAYVKCCVQGNKFALTEVSLVTRTDGSCWFRGRPSTRTPLIWVKKSDVLQIVPVEAPPVPNPSRTGGHRNANHR